MSQNKSTKNSFVTGAIIIAISNLVVKLIGAVYKIPLDRYILGTAGLGVYSASYTIYNLLFVISTAGLPVAISKMIAESDANRDYKKSEVIFSVAKRLLFTVGLICAIIMFFGSKIFANLIGSPNSYYTTMVMAPSLFFVALSSAYRGYYQGHQNMYPTAISEVIEALSKLVFGLSIAYIVKLKFDTYFLSSAGAIAGISIGTLLSVLFLTFYNLRDNKRKKVISLEDFKNAPVSESKYSILKKLVKIAVPITIGASVFTLTSFIDMATVMNTLSGLGYSEKEVTSLYGYLNRAITFFNMPPTIINGISISIVPYIASFVAMKKHKEAISSIRSAFKITLALAIPCGVGICVMASPILELFYNDTNNSFLLNAMGIAVIFVTLVQTSNAVLQAFGKVWVPVINMVIGGIFKIAINLILVSKPEININGAPIGTLSCYIIVMILNLIALKRCTKVKYGLLDFIFKPLLLSAITAFSAGFSYYLISPHIHLVIAIALSVAITALVYLLSIILFKGLSEDEILLLPKGEAILSKLKKLRIM